ncbi:hypothetical protein [Synechococcus phage BUCT-ZZ01]|nr:hypothetical protein [Synechococcus phage BUCT-ZZ01]
MNRIVCAANLVKLRDKEFLILGPRHFDATMHEQYRNTFTNDVDLTLAYENSYQGFIDIYGKYHTRKEAFKIAHLANQILPGSHVIFGELFSENMY